MKTSKFGTSVGKFDAAYTAIKTGDRLKNKHNGLEYTVTQHGHLKTNGGLVEKKWNGDDYIVIGIKAPQTHAHRKASQLKAAKPAGKTQNSPAQASEDPETDKGPAEAPKAPQTAGNEQGRPGDLTPSAAALLNASDVGLVEELRARGYTVICTKQIEVITYQTIEL